MSCWVRGLWLPSALLLIHVPGCLSLRGPGSVTGTVGGSLSVRCTYKEEDAENDKYWCKNLCLAGYKAIVKTSKTQQEERNGRVTIRDEPANLTFTVTVEALEEADAGTYYCGVSKPLFSVDPNARVELSVSPAPKATTTGPHLERAEPTGQMPPDPHPSTKSGMSGVGQRQMIPSTVGTDTGEDEHQEMTGSLLSSTHFLLLVFLKVPLLLGMMGAVLWVNWPRRGPRKRSQHRVTISSPE